MGSGGEARSTEQFESRARLGLKRLARRRGVLGHQREPSYEPGTDPKRAR